MANASTTASGDTGALVLGITWAEMGLASILILLRAKTASLCPSRQFSSGLLGLRWDFIWVMIAYILGLASQMTMTVSVYYGLGTHEDLLSYREIVQTNLWSWVAQAIAMFCMVIARIAVIAVLVSLQYRTGSRSKYLLYGVGALQFLINTTEIGLIFSQCTPVDKLWDQRIPGTCDGIIICSQVGFAQGSIGAASDFILAAYPMYIIGKLQLMKLSTKVGICLIMGGGLIAGIAAINKTIAIASITDDSDLTYVIYKLNTLTLTEMWFIIIFGSIPTLRPFFVKFIQDIKTAAPFPSRTSRSRSDAAVYRKDSREQRESWIHLNQRLPDPWSTHGTTASASCNMDFRQQIPDLERNEQDILVTKNTTVVSEQGTR